MEVAMPGSRDGLAGGVDEHRHLYSPAKEKAANRGRARQILLLSAGSARARKLLALVCVLAIFLLFTCRLSSLMGWEHRAPTHPSSSRSSSSSRSGYTVLINTWKRNSLLKKAVAHYASCARVDAIHVVWSEIDLPSESLKADLMKLLRAVSPTQSDHKPNFRFDLNKEDNLNNRFKPIMDLASEAIFSIDDDVIVPCPTLDFAFSVWENAPDTMVGFVPRMHWLAEQDGLAYYKYDGWWSVWWMGTYSMVLSKAAFFHKKYLDVYTYQMPSSIRDYVARERNCEDIAMSLLVANATGAAPVWVKGKIFEIGSSGISSLTGHNKKRNKCLNDFVSFYGAMPLVPTNFKAVDARDEWFW